GSAHAGPGRRRGAAIAPGRRRAGARVAWLIGVTWFVAISGPGRMLGMPIASTHPVQLPEPLFTDPELEKRWRQRFSAVRISLPGWARDAQERTSYVSNETGRYEVYCWDVPRGVHSVATDRPDGTTHATLSADGREL